MKNCLIAFLKCLNSHKMRNFFYKLCWLFLSETTAAQQELFWAMVDMSSQMFWCQNYNLLARLNVDIKQLVKYTAAL